MKFKLLFFCFFCSTICTAQSQMFKPVQTDTLLRKTVCLKLPSDNWFGLDKLKHFTVSMLVTGASGWIMQHRFKSNPEMSRPVGAAFAFSLGITKELLDHSSPGNHFSWRDVIADILGIIAGGLLLIW